MSNAYKYLDPDYTYTDPKTGILRNLQDITDADVAQREFLRLLAIEKGLNLNLNPLDNKSVYERYMKGTIESDLRTLTELIYELIETKNKT